MEPRRNQSVNRAPDPKFFIGFPRNTVYAFNILFLIIILVQMFLLCTLLVQSRWGNLGSLSD